jgi:hypothetical protein
MVLVGLLLPNLEGSSDLSRRYGDSTAQDEQLPMARSVGADYTCAARSEGDGRVRTHQLGLAQSAQRAFEVRHRTDGLP